MTVNSDTLTQLNLELMEALELCLYCAEDFCTKNNIPFHNPKLAKLLRKVTMLMEEIDPPPFYKSSEITRRIFTGDKSDKDLTQPTSTKPY